MRIKDNKNLNLNFLYQKYKIEENKNVIKIEIQHKTWKLDPREKELELQIQKL